MKKEATWEIIKNKLVFEFYGNQGEHTIWLTEDRHTDIITKTKNWIREGEHGKKGISFEEFRTYLCKTEIYIHYYPIWKSIIIPVQLNVGKGAKTIFLQHNKPLLSAIRDCCHLL